MQASNSPTTRLYRRGERKVKEVMGDSHIHFGSPPTSHSALRICTKIIIQQEGGGGGGGRSLLVRKAGLPCSVKVTPGTLCLNFGYRLTYLMPSAVLGNHGVSGFYSRCRSSRGVFWPGFRYTQISAQSRRRE